ncbi:MAG: hypothetical protein WA419_19815 [Silvibacterium sp.]
MISSKGLPNRVNGTSIASLIKEISMTLSRCMGIIDLPSNRSVDQTST